MSEVQRFWSHDAYNIRCVREADFDRVTAELQRQLDHKEQQRESEIRNGQAGDRLVGELQQRLTAADERADVLEGLLRNASAWIKRNSFHGTDAIELWERIDDALKPAECCTVSAEDRALLDAGDYTPEELFGIGGKPSCPKCAP